MATEIKNLIKDLKQIYREEYREHRELAKARFYKGIGFDTPVQYMNQVESYSDDENTLWEQGYRAGLNAAIEFLNKQLQGTNQISQ